MNPTSTSIFDLSPSEKLQLMEEIRRSPEMHAVVHENYRRGLAVFYEYAEGTETVYGAFHTSRDPDKWRQRLPL